MKKAVFLLAALAMFLAVAPNQATAKTLRMSNMAAPDSVENRLVQEVFIPYIEKNSDGRYTIDYYPNSALGNAETVVQGLAMGTVDLAMDTASNFDQFCTNLGLLDLPYLFAREDIAKLNASSVGEKLRDSGRQSGVQIIDLNCWFPRNLIARKPLHSIADMQNIKNRTTGSKWQMLGAEAMGLKPVPVPAAEMMTAIQQGMVDSMDINLPAMLSFHVSDVAKHATITNQAQMMGVVACSTEFWDELSPEDRQLFLDAAKAYSAAQAKAEEKARKSLQVRADFYTELARLSGNYGESLEYQVQLIEKQAADWVLAGISLDDVNRRAALMRQELSHDAFAGLARGARTFGADYGDVAAQVESLTTQMGSHISNTLADAFMRGKFSAQDFFSSLVGMAAQAASNAFIGKIFGGLGSLFSFGGADAVAQSSVSSASSVINQGVGVAAAMRHTGGLADASGAARQVPLAAFVHAPRFHTGGGIFGADEYPAVLLRGERVLNREETRAYDARMAAPVYAPSAQAPQVNINIDNRTGADVEAQGQARPDGNGGFTLDIMLAQVEQGLVTRTKAGKSQLFQYQETAYGLGRAAVLARGRGRA